MRSDLIKILILAAAAVGYLLFLQAIFKPKLEIIIPAQIPQKGEQISPELAAEELIKSQLEIVAMPKTPAEDLKEKPILLPGPTQGAEPVKPTPIVPNSTPIPVEQPKPKEEITQAAVPQKPAIDEDKIARAVVRIRCGRTFGSGFAMKLNNKFYALTSAHVTIDRIEAGNFSCDIIFPRYDSSFEFYQEAHYRAGKILAPAETEKNYKEKGFDLALIEIIPLEDKSEDARVFPNGYPFINYEFCPAGNLYDQITLWGYAANLGTAISPGAILSRFEGLITQYADVSGTTKKSSPGFAGGYEYVPKLTEAADNNIQHPIVIIVSDNNFSGASGGLVFDLNKSCIVGTNTATTVQNNKVFGLVVNPNFEPIREWLENMIKK